SRGEVLRDDQGRSLKVLGACLDITEQKNSEAALRAAADNLQALTRRLVEAEEAERRRIARELHDRVGQNLSALNITLALAACAPRRRWRCSASRRRRSTTSPSMPGRDRCASSSPARWRRSSSA